MTKDEMKNKISMALKDPALQQGFEIICKDLAISEHDREHNDYELAEVYKQVKELKEENAELEKELEQAKKVQVVEHFEAYGQCRDSRRIASLEIENTELKEEIKKWKDEWQEQVQKANDEGYARTLQTIQLNKAKKIIGNLYAICKDNHYPNTSVLIEQAEQFLKESE